MSPHDLFHEISNLVTDAIETISFFFTLIWNMDFERWFGWFVATGILISVFSKMQEFLTKKFDSREDMKSFVAFLNSSFVNYFFGFLSFLVGFYWMSISNWKP